MEIFFNICQVLEVFLMSTTASSYHVLNFDREVLIWLVTRYLVKESIKIIHHQVNLNPKDKTINHRV